MNTIYRIFADIDRRAKKENRYIAGLEPYRRDIWIVLLVTAVSLLAVNYLKYSSSFYHAISMTEELFGVEGRAWTRAVRGSTFASLYASIWWAGWHYLFFLMIPMLVVKKLFKRPVSAFGWQLGDTFKHWKIYLVTIVFFIIFLTIFSHMNKSFAHYYPYYKLSYRSWFDLIVWELLYVLQFVALEFFFRGFLLQGLRIPFGSLAIPIMIVPYMMIHLPKLWPEATGAILFGIFLGVLALRSRSIWGGVAIHLSVALTLDISALLQGRGVPHVWFPG